MTTEKATQAIQKCKTVVYKNRIRIRDFFRSFDKLRCGYITPSKFCSGLSMAGVNLSPAEIESIVTKFTEACHNVPSMSLVNYQAFCDSIDEAFTVKNLEKEPLQAVKELPVDILNTNRYQRCEKGMSEVEEEILNYVLAKFAQVCKIKRILVKPVFDDAAANKNSTLSVNRVTANQFKQALNVKLGLQLKEDEVAVLLKKFDDNDDGMVNYVAFANVVDPPEQPFDPYSLK